MATEWLSSWLAAIDLPDEFKFFGDLSVPSLSTLQYQVSLVSRAQELSKVQFFVEATEQDTGVSADWNMLDISQALMRSGVCVEWVLVETDIQEVIGTFGGVFASLKQLYNGVLSISSISSDTRDVNGGKFLMCTTPREGTPRYWAAQTPELGMNSHWGESALPVVRSREPWQQQLTTVTVLDEQLAPQVHRDSVSVAVLGDLNCNSFEFGAKFVQFTIDKFPELGHRLADSLETIEQITYSDRFLRSPLTVMLLFRLLRALLRERGQDVPVQVAFDQEFDKNKSPLWPQQNFGSAEQCRLAISSLLSTLTNNSTVTPSNRQGMPHQRRLTIVFANGDKYVVEFDQGMGSWQARTRTTLPTTNAELIKKIAILNVPITIYPFGTTISFRKGG